MFGNILGFCVLAWLVQGRNCDTVQDVINDLGPTLVQLAANIGTVIATAPPIIDSVQEKADASITTAEINVGDQLNDLFILVDQKTSLAEQGGKDITECLNAESDGLIALNLNALEDCRSTFDFDALRAQVTALGPVQKKIQSSVDTCLLANPNNVPGFRQCNVDNVAYGQGQLDAVQDQLDNLDKVLLQVRDCVETTLGILDMGIEDVEHDSIACCDKILG